MIAAVFVRAEFELSRFSTGANLEYVYETAKTINGNRCAAPTLIRGAGVWNADPLGGASDGSLAK
jgi:hypothetical protein